MSSFLQDFLNLDINPPCCTGYGEVCPFASLDEPEGYFGPYSSNTDEAEAHYHCKLLNKRVWGENPECEAKDWDRVLKLKEEMLKLAGDRISKILDPGGDRPKTCKRV